MRTVITVPKLAALSFVVLFGIALRYQRPQAPSYGTLKRKPMTGKSPMGSGKSKVVSIMLREVDALSTRLSVKRTGTTTPLKRKSDWMSTIGRGSFSSAKRDGVLRLLPQRAQ